MNRRKRKKFGRRRRFLCREDKGSLGSFHLPSCSVASWEMSCWRKYPGHFVQEQIAANSILLGLPHCSKSTSVTADLGHLGTIPHFSWQSSYTLYPLPRMVWLPASSVVSKSHGPSTTDRSGPRISINVINTFASLSSTAIMEIRIQMCGGCISIHTHSVPEAAQGCQPA